ncbi:MAG: hypothetical protein JNM56_20255 [Planctomycetia bacterium]|nr:hypothetical protein [Planctomycetia bacterium]
MNGFPGSDGDEDSPQLLTFRRVLIVLTVLCLALAVVVWSKILRGP